MTATKISKPFNVEKRAGRNITPVEKDVLRLIELQMSKRGYSVLGSLFARVPGLLTFFATTYLMDEQNKDSLPPFGVTRVSFLRNGDVTVKVMGCVAGEGEHVTTETKWN